jgi:hypothetical protein
MLNFLGRMPLFRFFNAQTRLIKSKTHDSIAVFFLKPYTLAGFEPGFAVSDADFHCEMAGSEWQFQHWHCNFGIGIAISALALQFRH